MKKFLLIIFVALCMCIAFAGCANNSGNSESASSGESASQGVQSSSAEEGASSSGALFGSSIADYTNITFNHSNAKKYYPVGASFSSINISVTGDLGENTNMNISTNLWELDTSAFNKDEVGKYEIKMTAGTLSESFYVEVVPKPEAVSGVVNFKIDATYSGSTGALVDGYYSYSNLTDFLSVANAASLSSSTIKNVYIAAGDYFEQITISMANVRFIGESAETTKLSWNSASWQVGGSDATAAVTVTGESFMAKNITFQNTFDYLADTAHSEKAALAMLVKGDKAVFTDCVFLSYQDTLQAKSGRQYYKNCTIKGSVDFIFGNNPAALFEDCDIVTLKTNNSNGGYVTAMKGNAGTNGQKVATYGIVFKNCRLTAEEGVAAHSVALGRPWRADATVAYINCEMGEHIGLNACGESNSRYTSMSGGGLNYPKDAHYAEYGNTGDGAVTEATDDFTMLTAEQAALYTMENIFATTNGDVTYSGEFDAASALSVLQAIEFPA